MGDVFTSLGAAPLLWTPCLGSGLRRRSHGPNILLLQGPWIAVLRNGGRYEGGPLMYNRETIHDEPGGI